MSTQQELDKLEKEIKLAQEKLSDIMTAINQENLALEDRNKEKENIIKELELLKSDIENRKEEERDALNNFKDNKELQNKQILQLKDNIKESIQKFEEEKLEKESILNILSLELEKLKGQDKTIKDEIDSKNSELLNLIVEKSKELQKLEDDIFSKKQEKSSVDIELAGVQKEIDLLGLIAKKELLNEIEEKTKDKEREFYNLNDLISTKESSITDLDKYISGLFQEKKDLLQQVNETKKILEFQSLEKDEFIKAKFILQKDKEALGQREELIKEKYQAAGVNYS